MAAALGALPALAEMGPRIGPDKKIIHYFQYWPDAAYCRANVRAMERLPFDAIAIGPTAEIDGKREKIWFRWFSPEVISEALVADTIRDLKATTFRKFTDNFLQMASQCGPLGAPSWWDDDAWGKITANMVLAARVCRECKLKGIVLDVEQYGAAASPYMERFNYPYAQAFAMLNSDRYVWVYSELDGAVFIENVYGYWQDPKEHARPTVPEEYLREMERAREGRNLDTGEKPRSSPPDGLKPGLRTVSM